MTPESRNRPGRGPGTPAAELRVLDGSCARSKELALELTGEIWGVCAVAM